MKINEDFTQRSKLCDLGRWYVTEFVRSVAARLAPGTRLLDAGAGECAYKRFFAHCRYVAMDFGLGEASWNYSNLDAFARLDALPVREGSVDAILCTQVLGASRAAVAGAPGNAPGPEIRRRSLSDRSHGSSGAPGAARFLPLHVARAALALRGSRLPGPRDRGLRRIPDAARLRDSPAPSSLSRIRVEERGASPRGRSSCFRSAPPLSSRSGAFQRLLLWADRFDRERIDPFGWSVVARKA